MKRARNEHCKTPKYLLQEGAKMISILTREKSRNGINWIKEMIYE
jgi:hypothetical protein